MNIAIQGSDGLFDRVVIVYGLTRGLPSRYEAVSIIVLGSAFAVIVVIVVSEV
jgi:hypothetical protein